MQDREKMTYVKVISICLKENSGRKRRGYIHLIRHEESGKFEFQRYIRFPSRKKTLSSLYSLFKESFCFCFWCYLLLSALPAIILPPPYMHTHCSAGSAIHTVRFHQIYIPIFCLGTVIKLVFSLLLQVCFMELDIV